MAHPRNRIHQCWVLPGRPARVWVCHLPGNNESCDLYILISDNQDELFYILICLHAYIHAYRQTYIHMYIRTHTYIYIYIYMHPHIHIYIYARTHITCVYIYTHMWMKFNDFEKTLCISCWHDIFIHHHGHDKLNAVNICMVLNIWLVVWNILYFHILGIIWNNHPNWRTHIFQRGRTTNQNYWYYNHYYSIIPLLMIIQL